MQTTLLGLAIAIILALVSALVAPLVIDWNRYRGAFEQEAGRLVGATVRINGTINARILPTPRIELHNVEVGEAGRQTEVRAGTIELELGLGPLIRGEVRATELRLVAPQISIGLDRSGAIDWSAAAASFRPDALTISRLTIEDGSVTLSDAGSGSHLVLQKLWFNGDIRSFIGPFHGEGAFVVGDELYGYRITGGEFSPDAGLKIRLAVEPSNHPLTTEIEGTVKFDQAVPQFDGTLSAARPVGATLALGERVMSDPWRLTGKVHATPASASLQELALQYGPDERAVNLTGKAELTFGARPHLDGKLSARQVDVDRALAAPDVTHRPPFLLIKSFAEAFVATVKPPLPVAVEVGVDAVTVGGTTLQSVRGNVGFDGKGWSLNDFAFRAPGYTEISFSGHLDNGRRGLSFNGPAKIVSTDLKALMAWLEGRREPPAGPSETFTARGAVSIASDRFAVDRFSAKLEQEEVEGRLAYTWATPHRPATMDGELHAATLNVDALTAFARAALSDSALEVPHQVALVLDVGKATFAGVDALKVNARVKFDAGIFHIDRLSIGDLGGAAVEASGRIDELSSQPRGRLTLDVDAITLAGVSNIAGRLLPQAAAALRSFADRLAPAKIHGVLTVDRAAASGTIAKLDLNGTVGALRLSLDGQATGDPARPATAAVRLASRFDSDDGGAIVHLLGLDRVFAVDQLPGQMTVSANGALNGDLHINGLAAAGGFSAAVDGMLHLAGDQAPSGNLQLKLLAADPRPLHRAVTGQPGAAIPVSASAIVGIAGADLAVTDVVVNIGKSSVRGRLDLKVANPLGIGGSIEANDADATAVLAMLLGLPAAAGDSSAIWSPDAVGIGAFDAMNGAVTFKVERAALSPTLVVRGLNGVIRFQPPAIALTRLDGRLAGGHLTGDMKFRRDAEEFALQGHVELTDARAAALLAPLDRSAVDGLLTVKLQADSLGKNPESLIGALHGGGTITLKDGRFSGIDSAAFPAAILAADQSGLIETAKIQSVVTAAIANGHFAVPQGDAQVTITGGQVHLTNALIRVPSGDTLSLDGIVDLNKLAIDAHMTLSGQPAPNALIPIRPEFTVTFKGALAAPARTVDVSALVGWLTLRATELQTRRLESVEANRRNDVLGPVVRPASPALRFIPKGTALETTDHANAAAGIEPGARAFDRLRSEAPSAAPGGRADRGGAALPAPGGKPTSPRSGQGDKATATADPDGTRNPAPPAPRSPLDLLFRSQN